jgi:hypothetical protein
MLSLGFVNLAECIGEGDFGVDAGDAHSVLDDPVFLKAITGIKRRAEQQQDPEKIVDVFVQTDLPSRCDTEDTQLILGRRGTGKTHLLRYVEKVNEQAGQPFRYCDCRMLGSGLQDDRSTGLAVGAKYFRALARDFTNFLMDRTVLLERPPQGLQDRVVNKLTQLTSVLDQQDCQNRSNFDYAAFHDCLSGVFGDLGYKRVTVVLDEWAAVPPIGQPYLAEFLKRALLTVPNLTLKVLAVNYQCRFADSIEGNPVGMQRGADFVDVIDLDGYLVFEENRTFVEQFFGQLLYNHLGAEMKWDLSAAPEQKVARSRSLFTQDKAFTELVRAAEGNARDLMCIFSRAYFDSYRKKSTRTRGISVNDVYQAASTWYETEKESNIKGDPDPQKTLSYLMDNVLKGYKSRTFLVEKPKAEHRCILRLLNERVLHRLNETYSHPDRPGLRYEIFTLDYGAYVRYRGTKDDPDRPVFLFEDDLLSMSHNDMEFMVPLDDKRSIRRIVFDPDAMSVQV